jgi:hypothetical protein
VSVLRNLLTADALPTDLRVDVVKVLCQSDIDGARLRPVFKVLLQEAIREDLAVEVRRQILLRVQRLLPAKASLSRDTAAEEYIQLLSGLQESDAPEIRLAAARLLVVPENLSAEYPQKLGKFMIESVGSRLLVETDETVFAAQVTVLRNLAAKDEYVGGVNGRLRKALDELRGKAAATERLDLLVGGLKQLALNERSTAADWYETCSRLMEPPLADRQSVRSILQYHVGRDSGQKLSAASPDLQVSIHKLVLRTAALRPATSPWKTEKNDGEAKMVQAAFRFLRAGKEFTKDTTIDTAPVRMASLRCLAAMKDAALLGPVLELWLDEQDQVIQGADRDVARVLYAEALVLLGKPTEAWAVSGIQQVAGPSLPERLRVADAIVAELVERKAMAAALPVLVDVIQRTAPSSSDYWRRFELGLRLRYQVDPKQGLSLLKELDTWVATHNKLTPELKAATDKLRSALSGTAKPGK